MISYVSDMRFGSMDLQKKRQRTTGRNKGGPAFHNAVAVVGGTHANYSAICVKFKIVYVSMPQYFHFFVFKLFKLL